MNLRIWCASNFKYIINNLVSAIILLMTLPSVHVYSNGLQSRDDVVEPKAYTAWFLIPEKIF